MSAEHRAHIAEEARMKDRRRRRLAMKTFQTLTILYDRNGVWEKKWEEKQGESMVEVAAVMMAASPENEWGFDMDEPLMVETFEGMKAVTVTGEEALIIVAETKVAVRVAHSFIVEQNEGY